MLTNVNNNNYYYCMLSLLACREAHEFGQFGTGLFWFRSADVPKADEFFFLKNQHRP